MQCGGDLRTCLTAGLLWCYFNAENVNSFTSQPTSHIWSWKRRRSFSISSAISAPVISVRIIPCCLACSRFSFSIFVLTQRRGRLSNVSFFISCMFVILQCVQHLLEGTKYIAAHNKQCLIHYSALYNELDGANMQYYNSKFNYPLTTWPRSLSMLCRRASLCPAETEEEKHQQTTKRSLWGRRYLQSWIATKVPANASLGSGFMPWTASERPRPSLYPEHQRFMTQFLATRHKAQHKGSVYFCKIYSVSS